MPGCASFNCTNHTRRGFRLFCFPADQTRRAIWIQNCGRNPSTVTKYLRLCEAHFDYNQFENRRLDGIRKLKPNAIPTLFNVPNSAASTTSLQGTTKDDVGESLDNVKQKLCRTEEELQRLKKEKEQLQNVINSNPFLDLELKEILCRGKKVCKWSPQLIQRAIRIRFAVGWKGYIYLRKTMHFCLPSYNTICRHLQNVAFNSGLLPLLAERRRELKHESESECLLLMGEMEIKESLEYDRRTGLCVGYSTIKRDATKQKLGDQLFVFMLRGLNSNWKQIIAYHVTNQQANNEDTVNLVKYIIIKVEQVGYKVLGLVSDLRSKNQAVWRNLGVSVGRYSNKNVVAHPLRTQEHLYIFADPSHLLKKLGSALMKHDITIPENVVDKEKMSSNTVNFKYIIQLVNYQREYDLKLTPNLTERVLNLTTYGKMDVAYAAYIFSTTTASAMETLVKLGLMSNHALTTAWFLQKVRMWFEVLNSRSREASITNINKSQHFATLNTFIELIHAIKIGNGVWKPVQTGIIITTTNAIQITEESLTKNKYKYVLTSRFNQYALENIFSILRGHANNNPTALQAIRTLKLITVSQFFDSNTEHGKSDKHHINLSGARSKSTVRDFPDTQPSISEKTCVSSAILISSDDSNSDHIPKDLVQQNIVINLLRAVIFRSFGKLCRTCKNAFKRNSRGKDREVLIRTKTYGKLLYPADNIFNFIVKANEFISNHLKLCGNHPNLVKHLFFLIKRKYDLSSLPSCAICKSANLIIKNYISLRLNIEPKTVKYKNKQAKK